MIKQNIKIGFHYLKGYVNFITNSELGNYKKNGKYAFIFFSADYDNLGDIAITVAQERFLSECLDDTYEIIKVPVSKTYEVARQIKKLEKNNILITMIGGGNNGSLYEFIETPRRFILRIFKNYKIISFPQTVVFENTSKAIPYKKEFIRCCNKCSQLTLVAREQKSYETYCKIQKSKVLLTPDIVLSLGDQSLNIKRENYAAFIMRNDNEKAIDVKIQNKLLSLAKMKCKKIYYWDTCDIKYIPDKSELLVSDFLRKLSTVKFVVTDRLHGMILCYISHTPCIAIDNNNGKIKSTYETWMKNQNFIKLYSPLEGINRYIEIINYLLYLDSIIIEDLQDEFVKLKNILRKD